MFLARRRTQPASAPIAETTEQEPSRTNRAFPINKGDESVASDCNSAAPSDIHGSGEHRHSSRRKDNVRQDKSGTG